MDTGIILLNFEPGSDAGSVAYLERIFRTNMALEGHLPPERVRERVKQLAEERAPGLIEELESIGGSPLHRQAVAQADALEAELARRGQGVRCYVAYQFTEPLIADVVRQAREDGVSRVIGLPVYPLAGPSTWWRWRTCAGRSPRRGGTWSSARSAGGTGTPISRRCGRMRCDGLHRRRVSTSSTRGSGWSSPCTERR